MKQTYSTFSITVRNSIRRSLIIICVFAFIGRANPQFNPSGISLGQLTNYLLVFTNGSVDANWQGASKGFLGDVAVNGVLAKERTSGSFAYAGTISTNDNQLGAWQNIVNNNNGQAHKQTNRTSLLSSLNTDLQNAFSQINAKPVSPGFAGVNSSSLDGLNTQNGVTEFFIININSGFTVTTRIDITGDAGDLYFLRWDSDQNFSNGYNGKVKFQSGGAIIPHGGLKATNFVSVAGDIASSGGGNNPEAPFPQGPRTNNGTGSLINNGSDFHGGGFFTGYWLTTGDPASGQTSSLSNAIFVGGWFSSTVKFSMTSGTSGVYVSPPMALNNPLTWGTRGNFETPETEVPQITNLKTYPNPVTNDVHITIPSQWQNKNMTIEIFNSSGQLVMKSQTANSHQTETVNMAQLKSGIYIMKLNCENQTASQKILRQ